MTPGRRLAACLLGASLLATAALAWLRWPAGDGSLSPAAPAAPAASAAEIEQLRAAVERERERLQAARSRHDQAAAELRAIEQSLEEAERRVELLQAGPADGGDGRP